MTTQTEQAPTEDTNQDWAAAIAQSNALDGASEVDATAEETTEQDVPEGVAAFAPTTEPIPTTPASAAPSIEETRLLAENTQLIWEGQEQAREAGRLQRRQLARDQAQEWTEQLVMEGWEEQQAQQFAYTKAGALLVQYEGRETQRELVALQEGVPMEVLSGAQDETSMRQKAQEHKQMAGPQRQELNTMKREMAQLRVDLKKAQVPSQNYDQPSGASGSSSDIDTWRKYGRGELDWSPKVQKAGRTLGHL